jgi:hypothetical protein
MLAVLRAANGWTPVLLFPTWMSTPPSMFSTTNTSAWCLNGVKWAIWLVCARSTRVAVELPARVMQDAGGGAIRADGHA